MLDAASLSVGIGTWNINHLGIDTKEPKKSQKLGAIQELFRYNEWLELLALQEVNKTGVPLLEACFAKTGALQVLHAGPLLYTESYETKREFVISHRNEVYEKLGEETIPKPYKGESIALYSRIIGSTGFAAWYRNKRKISRRYQEYYPLVAPKDTRITVRQVHLFWGTGCVSSVGTGADVEICYKDGDDERTGRRVAESNGNRPVVVFQLQKGKQTFFVGIVHTSPHGDEWHRYAIYDHQMQAVFRKVAEHVDKKNGLWILLGDYYLTPEARVVRRIADVERNVAGATFEKKLPKQLQIVTTISGTNTKSEIARPAPVPVDRDTTVDWLLDAQIADFLVCSHNWDTARAGLFKERALMAASESGGLLVYDDYHLALHAWDTISDHAPVGAYLSTRDDPRILEVLGYDERTIECARRNIEELRGSRLRERWLKEKTELAKALEVSGGRPDAWRRKKRHLYDWQLQQYKKRIRWLYHRIPLEPTDFAPDYRGRPAEPARVEDDPEDKSEDTRKRKEKGKGEDRVAEDQGDEGRFE